MRTYHIAWWNLENLFDEEDAVALGRRTDKVFRAIKDDIAGWTPQLRDREVENRFVADRVVERVNGAAGARSYAVVHADTGDARGIDVAFIYDDTLFQVPLPLAESVFFHVVMRRNATREIVQVNFKTTTAAARTWAVFGNHWPSRSGGQFESEGYRAIAGETLSYFHQRVLEVHGPQTTVLATGDFNDEPFDTSLVRHALSTRQRTKVTNARENPLLWNLMWPDAGLPDGSFYFDNQPNMLDQFLVNKSMATGDAPIKVNPGTAQILKPPAMVDLGDYPKPIPYGGLGDPVNQTDFPTTSQSP